MMKFKGVIFDFNGVIVDDYKIQKKSWDQISLMLRAKILTEKEWLNARGKRSEDFIRQLTRDKVDGKEKERLIKEKEALTKRAYNKNSRSILYSGIETFFNSLKEHGVPMTIATSCNLRMLRFYFNRLDLNQWFKFEDIIYNDGKHMGKPEPDVYFLACKQLTLKPSDCVVFEDAKSGLISANRAGIGKIIAVGLEKHLKELRKLPGVTQTIHDFTEVSANSILD